MTSTNTRPSLSMSDSPVESLAPVSAPASLAELRAALGSPGVIPAEVDALIAALAQRPEGDEALRERTDFLLSLMSLPGEASLQTGSAGITVHTAAVEALLELGYPYALEVPPSALEQARQERGRSTDVDRRGRAPSPTAAISTAFLGVLGQLLMVGFELVRTWDDLPRLLHPSLLVLGTPALLGSLGMWLKARPLQYMGSLGLGIQGLLWFTLVFLMTEWGTRAPQLWLLPWYLPLIAAYLMWPRRQSDDPVATLPGPEAES